MLRIKVFQNGAPATQLDLSGAFLLGHDRVPIRGDLSFSDGEIICESRARGAAALSLLWPVPGMGRLMLETPRLQERREPYHLHVELARGQLMRIAQKREDWGLYDGVAGEPVFDDIDKARDLLISALTSDDGSSAAKMADESLTIGLRAAEGLALFQADAFLNRRITAHQLSRRPLGVHLDPRQAAEHHATALRRGFDFGILPFTWAELEPREGVHRPGGGEAWLKLARAQKVPVWGAGLVSFEDGHLPDWLVGTTREYESIREAMTRHLRRVVKTYGAYVQAWEVMHGIHAQSAFRLTFEQMMDLTRAAALVVKQAAPRSMTVLGITRPWGEYYASDPRSIPPAMYAEMAVQSGVNFDAFGLDLSVGAGQAPNIARDLMQISSLLDRFGGLGKPVHVTAAGVPSGGGEPHCGHWHAGWTDEVQAEWLQGCYRIALSKPFVESIAWMRLADHEGLEGVLNRDGSPKRAWETVVNFRKSVLSAGS